MRSPERHRQVMAGAALLLALTVAGCSGGSLGGPASNSTAAPAIQPAAQQQLRTDVHSVSAAAARGDLAGARAALTTLKTDLAAASAAGSITATRFAQIRQAADAVDAELALRTTPPPSRTTVTVAPPAPHGGDKGKKGKKSDHGDGGD